MDLIGGIVVVTAAFLVAAALVGHWVSSAPWVDDPARHQVVDQTIQRRSQTMFATLLIGYFVGLADILVAAQLGAIAFANVLVGAATLAILFSVARQRARSSDRKTGADSARFGDNLASCPQIWRYWRG